MIFRVAGQIQAGGAMNYLQFYKLMLSVARHVFGEDIQVCLLTFRSCIILLYYLLEVSCASTLKINISQHYHKYS